MAGSSRNELFLRIVSALVLAPVVIFLAWLGAFWFAALMGLISIAMYWEWTVITMATVRLRRDIIAGLIILGLIAASAAGYSILSFLVSTGLIVAGWIMRVILHQKPGWIVAGIGVASSLAACLIYVRAQIPFGFEMLLFICFTVWAADSAAYAVGRTVGGPKLMPKVSPKKTWSGFIGGVIGAAIVGSMVASWGFDGAIAVFLILAIILALAAQVGDLLESVIKRKFNVKDASNLIPGHGGVLDRVDGLTLAAYAFTAIHAIGIVQI